MIFHLIIEKPIRKSRPTNRKSALPRRISVLATDHGGSSLPLAGSPWVVRVSGSFESPLKLSVLSLSIDLSLPISLSDSFSCLSLSLSLSRSHSL
jgi:hypothetical protein